LEKIVAPIAEEFRPELIIVSAGQDANVFDPLARMMVTAKGYGEIASMVKKLAEELCTGRLVVSHEGGYSPAYVPFWSLRIIESLSGLKSRVTEDPYHEVIASLPVNILKNNQKEAVDKVIEWQSDYWGNLKTNSYVTRG